MVSLVTHSTDFNRQYFNILWGKPDRQYSFFLIIRYFFSVNSSIHCLASLRRNKTWRNEHASRLLHLVTVLRMLLVRQWQAVFMCLFLPCSRAPGWLVLPQLLQHSSDSSPQPQLFTGPRSNKSPCIVSPRHFRGCLYIVIASIYNSEHPAPGPACGRLLWWLWHKVQWYLFFSMTWMLSAVPEAAARRCSMWPVRMFLGSSAARHAHILFDFFFL